ncbi:hypothetical protein BK138_08465 [Paenibacillus rhizosphaerae]|uniref:Uncharacterized protein n=1 Tax=Paenibacillus rhizosphaerae TaxID=297318 RepID=A0A1R1F3C9_9BACL|nr:hypothetical protein [Paenibacillus rhizosphaerae]OMF58535.1 hypothetical protein BK138_08465 [Paenibacillus rhizosphaerae]
MMATYGIIVGTYIVTAMIEARCRNGGDPIGALAARRFGRFFLLGAGLALSWQWIAGMVELLR